MLDQFEKVRLTIDTTAQNIGANTKFSLEVKPQAGAILPVYGHHSASYRHWCNDPGVRQS